MEADGKSLHQMLVPELKRFLMERGITCSFHRKGHLLRLCSLAVELNLEKTESKEDYEDMDRSRRTVIGRNGEEIVLLSVTKIDDWDGDLKALPNVESCDVLIYCKKYCGWTEERLGSFKDDNGYRLYLANHTDFVQLHEIPDTDYVYVKSTCIPETRQSENPYTTWILVNKKGYVKSGGCSCVVNNGTCKHCIALLFAVQSFCSRHQDRNTESVTDVPCIWDKPRKSSEPQTINKIDVRRIPTNDIPVEPNHFQFKPSRNVLLLSNHETEKRIHKLCKDNDSLMLHTLSDSSSASKDEDVKHNQVPLTMIEIGDALKNGIVVILLNI